MQLNKNKSEWFDKVDLVSVSMDCYSTAWNTHMIL